MDFLTQEPPSWPWSKSLAAVPPDPTRTYRVVEIVASFARERCEALDIVPGTRIRPRIRAAEELVVELPDHGHRICSLEVPYGWYVRVEPDEKDARPPPSGGGRPSGSARHPDVDSEKVQT